MTDKWVSMNDKVDKNKKKENVKTLSSKQKNNEIS